MHSLPRNAQPLEAPKPFLVDKLEEVPSTEISHPTLEDQLQIYAESAIIYRFNGIWPRTTDIYQWIHSTWTKNYKVIFCSKGFFIVVLAFSKDYQIALDRKSVV